MCIAGPLLQGGLHLFGGGEVAFVGFGHGALDFSSIIKMVQKG